MFARFELTISFTPPSIFRLSARRLAPKFSGFRRA